MATAKKTAVSKSAAKPPKPVSQPMIQFYYSIYDGADTPMAKVIVPANGGTTLPGGGGGPPHLPVIVDIEDGQYTLEIVVKPKPSARQR